jgi:dienelactone hydrolase
LRIDVLERSTEEGWRSEELILVSTSGLSARALVQSPVENGTRYPATVLMGGMRTGRTVIERVPKDIQPMVWMSVDYLYQAPPKFPGIGSVLTILPEAEEGAVKTLSAVCLALDYLESRPDVDDSRTLLAGGSLGAFVAVVVGAIDSRFDAVASLYGGGNLCRIVGANLPWSSGTLRAMAGRGLNPWLGPVDPALFAPDISPRPFLMVNGLEDSRMPRQSVMDLYEAAGDPKKIIWLDTAHRIQDETALMETATAAVFDWLTANGWFDQGP